MIISIYIGNDKIDLFKDETIEVNSSIINSSDITKNTTDFSKNFTVPASDRNNQLFKHYYNATIDNGFDARVRVAGRIEVDGFIYREGKFSLIGAKLKQNKPLSYSLVFYGNLVSLVDIVKDDEIDTLDLSEYNHLYNSTNVRTGLQSSLFSGKVVYSLFAKKRYYYDSSAGANENTALIANIANNGGSVNGIVWSDLRPSITLLAIIEAIEDKYDIEFSRDFFGRVEFKNLMLWINRDSSNITFEKRVDFTSGTNPYLNFTTDEATYEFDTYRRIETLFRVEPKAGFMTVPYIIKMYVNGSVYKEQQFIGNSPVFGKDITINDGVQKVYFTITSFSNFEFDAIYRVKGSAFGIQLFEYVVDADDNFIVANIDISSNLPKIKVIDFLKGIFNMFKLVVVQGQTDGIIYVNDLNSFYRAGRLFPITPYVSTKEQDVERGKLLNEILYKFQEPTTILNKEFKTNTGDGYGDEDLILQDENGKLLDGTKQDYSVPFEQVVYERLTDQNDNSLTNVMYGAIISDTLESTNIKPHLHYVINQSVGAKTVYFKNDIGVTETLSTFINLPSHTMGLFEPQFSTVFGSEINEFSFDAITNTLFTNYHKDYILSIFNVKRRAFQFDAKLPIPTMLQLRLNDVLEIKGEYYRINDFTYNLMTQKTKLNLINSFDNTINPFVASTIFLNFGGEASTLSLYVSNFDTEDGVSAFIDDTWITGVTNEGNNIFVTVNQNNSGELRFSTLGLQNKDSLEMIEIQITQAPAVVTFGNTEILFGNELITFE
jgi:hypothetical protein